MIVPFELNGAMVYIDANPAERLVHILRQRYRLTGSKEGCLSGRCGSCTVLMNGKPVPSCIVPIFQARNATVETIEHFRESDACRDVLEGFRAAGVTTCGHCDAGKIFVADAIIRENERPSKEDIKAMFSGNLCRCTSIDELVEGVRQAAIIRRKREHAQ